MTRTAFAACLVLLVSTASLVAGNAPQPPNIIILLADDLGYGDIAFRDPKSRIKTPNLDRWAKEGVRMDLFYSGGVNCSPTRATLLTGRNHNREGVFNHGYALRPNSVTIAHALRSVGYRTAHFGKWHVGSPGGPSPADMKDQKIQPTPKEMGFDTAYSTWNNDNHVNPKEYYHEGKPYAVQGSDNKFLIDKTLEFATECAREKRPFFIYTCFHTPHGPHGAEKKYLDLYPDEKPGKQVYWADITCMDEHLGRLRDEFKKRGLDENTIVIFTSDNGPTAIGSTAGLSGMKNQMSEGGTRVGALMDWPAKLKPEIRNDFAAYVSDLYPTLLAAAGMKSFGPQRGLDGENILPLLLRERQARKTPIFHFQAGVAMMQGDYKLYTKSADDLNSATCNKVTLDGTGLGEAAPAEVRERMIPALRQWAASVEADAGRKTKE